MISRAPAIARPRIMVPVAGGEMAVLRFGERGAPPLLFAHANGFCASAYRQMLQALGPRFDIFAIDLRGHGRTTLPTDPARHQSMDIFAEDIRGLIAALSGDFPAGRNWVLAGHSLGASSMMLAAAGRSDIAALRLIEPVATPRSWMLLARTPFWGSVAHSMPLVRGARGRRAKWPDRTSVKASYAKKMLFSTWAEGVLDDYLEDGLRETGDGNVALSCEPQWEAAVFAGQAQDFWGAVKRVMAPIKVLAARHASTTVPGPAVRQLIRLGVRVVAIEGRTHLAPFEDPRGVAEFLASA